MFQKQTIFRPSQEEVLYKRYAPQIFTYLLRHLLSQQDAEDLLVEVFLAILEKPPALDLEEQRYAAYLQAIARNKAASRTLIEHWNGSRWQVVPSPNGPQGNGFLRALTVVSPDDIWAVGSYGKNPSFVHPLMEHWNGEEWNVITFKGNAQIVGWLNSVAASSANDIWAVGIAFIAGKAMELSLHGNGSQWQSDTTPSTDEWTSISALSARDLWATTSAGKVEHWDGRQWQNIALPASETFQYSIWKIVALSDRDVWILGGRAKGQDLTEIVLHWTGQTWQQTSNPLLQSAHINLADLSISRNHQLWIAGSLNSSALILGQQTCP